VPFLIALSGLATDLGVDKGGHLVADTVLALTPGASEQLVRDLLAEDDRTENAGELALALGLLTGLIAPTTAMSQIERGANRIYGVERDRPALAKYARAAVLTLFAGVPRSPDSSCSWRADRWATRCNGTTRGAGRDTRSGTSCVGR
jgi:uncharacterized BrkB/YihY/UPF0761 family membrane protein